MMVRRSGRVMTIDDDDDDDDDDDGDGDGDGDDGDGDFASKSFSSCFWVGEIM